MEQLNIGLLRTEIGLSGYGAVRNLGLVVANTLGFDAVVFLDDDEVIDDPHFLQRAMYGLGKLTKKGIPILAKTGYYLNEQGSYLSKWEDKWYNHFWQQGRAFNEWISSAMKGPRLSRSNHVCGGCLAVHKGGVQAPRVRSVDRSRGRISITCSTCACTGPISGSITNGCCGTSRPRRKARAIASVRTSSAGSTSTASSSTAARSSTFSRSSPQSLEPYPGPFLEPGLVGRIRRTAFLRSLGRPDKKAYRRAAKAAAGEASAYAEQNCSKYFEFQYVWPEAMSRLDSDKILTTALVRSCVGGADRCDRPSSSDAPSASSVFARRSIPA